MTHSLWRSEKCTLSWADCCYEMLHPHVCNVSDCQNSGNLQNSGQKFLVQIAIYTEQTVKVVENPSKVDNFQSTKLSAIAGFYSIFWLWIGLCLKVLFGGLLKKLKCNTKKLCNLIVTYFDDGTWAYNWSLAFSLLNPSFLFWLLYSNLTVFVGLTYVYIYIK